MKKVILIISIYIPSLIMAQSNSVYVTDFKLLNKAEKWCWAISEDDNQNMLFGVERGVVVFDGINQELIKTPVTPLAMINDTNHKKIWVSGAESAGVLESDKMDHYKYTELESRSENDFTHIFVLSDTVYFISDSLIMRFNAVSQEKIDEFSTGDLLIDEILNFKGRLYFVIDYFLNIIDKDKLVELSNKDFPVDELSFAVTVNTDKAILGTPGNTIYTYNGKNYSISTLSSPFFENNRVTNGYYYNDSLIVISSLAGGVALYDFNKKKIVKQISYFNGLPDDEIRSTFVDNQKGIWVSHEFGISRIDLNLGIESYSYYPGLKGNPIALNYFQNNLYVATNDGLFALEEIKDYNEVEVKVKVPVNVKVEAPVEAKVNETQNESADNQNDEKQGFFLFRSKKKKSESKTESKTTPTTQTRYQHKVVQRTHIIKKRSLKSVGYYFKLVDGMNGKYTQMVTYSGFLLVAGNNGLYAIKDKKSETILKNTYMVYIYKTEADPAVYCCTDNGLYKVYRENGKWEIDHFAQTTSAIINSVAREKAGTWVIAYDKMLIRTKLINKKLQVVHEMTLPENPGQTYVVKNINDSLLVFTSNKLYQFTSDGKLNTLMDLNIDNYLIQNQNRYTWLFNSGTWHIYCNTKDRPDNSFLKRINLFGSLRYIDLNTNNELWLVDDKNQLFKLNEHKDKFESMSGVALNSVNSNNIQLQTTGKIKLNPNNNNLIVNFSAPYYLLQNGVSFSYLIEGLNQSWSDWTHLSDVSLGYVPPGYFNLKYKAKDAMGAISNTGTLEIYVPKPFTQSALFYLLIVVVIAVIAYLIFRIRLQKLKKDKEILEQKVRERTATIEKQKSEIEKQHDEITQSIRYAKRIQTAMLPHNEIIEAMLPNHFILFNPRDIVSGDFYFFKILGNKVIFIAADCTGHGVPGGFMSMLGISYLSEITSQLPTPTASEIIDHLRDKIKLTLGQVDTDSTQKDGMDLALCLIDLDKKQIQYAGAFNPLYHIRNGELESIPADRQPVAVYFKEHTFTNHVIDAQPNDRFYMFSDGFADQIGGPKQRKFMTKNFKELLLSLQDLPLPQQKLEMQKALNKWKGDAMQVDDILVIGFEL